MSAADRLPALARAIRRVESTLLDHVRAQGFDEVIVPMVEDAGVYLSDDAPRLVQDGQVMALRSDFTGPLARLVSTRWEGVDAPVRLAYRGIVFRGGHQRWQAGVEAYGTEAGPGDEEILRLALGAADALGLDDAVLVVGSVAAIEAQRPGALADPALRDALDRRDTSMLIHDTSINLVDVSPDVSALKNAIGPRLRPDPAHVRRFPYYTGIVFDLFAPGFPGPLGGGGRYDGLCARYGRPRSAIGFSLDVEMIARGRR